MPDHNPRSPMPAWMTLPGALTNLDEPPPTEPKAPDALEAPDVTDPTAAADAPDPEVAPGAGTHEDPAAVPEAPTALTAPRPRSADAAEHHAIDVAVRPEAPVEHEGVTEAAEPGSRSGHQDRRADEKAQVPASRKAPEDEPAEGPGLRAALEAILLVVDEPVAEITLAQVLERPTPEVAAALRELSAEYTGAGRGFDLREVAGGWRFYTRAECAQLVERFVRDGQQTRLTQAALETLAVVAYRQPVSRARVAAVRGVNSDGVMRTLVARGLVEEAGADPESQAVLYRTSSYFLERLGLKDLSELPELAPFLPDDVENLEETTK